jgi:hypothetical protein
MERVVDIQTLCNLTSIVRAVVINKYDLVYDRAVDVLYRLAQSSGSVVRWQDNANFFSVDQGPISSRKGPTSPAEDMYSLIV